MTNITPNSTSEIRTSKELERDDFGDEGKIARSEKSGDVDEDNGREMLEGRNKVVEGEGTRERSLDGDENGVGDGEKEVDVPPDGGYGWVCVACCFVINA